jgi:uncharacterized delta-60 repeat protein
MFNAVFAGFSSRKKIERKLTAEKILKPMIKRKLIKVLFAFFIATTIVQIGFAQAGSLDPTFGGTGIVTTGFAVRGFAKAVEVTKDGTTYVAGSIASPSHTRDILVMRYLSNGSLDTSFGGTGYVITNLGDRSVAYSLAVQNDGKILVAGSIASVDSLVVRYNPNGTLDSTFGIGGVNRIDFGNYDGANSVVVAPDGSIYVGGYTATSATSDIYVAKLNANGWFDPYFGWGGYIVTSISVDDYLGKLTLQSDGKIVATGRQSEGLATKMFIVRYGSFGFLDPTFDGDGIATYRNAKESIGDDVKVQNDGKIVVSGLIYNGIGDYLSLFRYNPDGSLDSTFGTGGATRLTTTGTGNPTALEIQSDGKIVVAGTANIAGSRDFITARFLANGSLDTGFAGRGYTTFDLGLDEFAFDLAINRLNRKITVVGWGSSQSITARYSLF